MKMIGQRRRRRRRTTTRIIQKEKRSTGKEQYKDETYHHLGE
tara:strand:- start:121 stop:246 length:126 start_codon:yes stop_codon:yes gene_type:complete